MKQDNRPASWVAFVATMLLSVAVETFGQVCALLVVAALSGHFAKPYPVAAGCFAAWVGVLALLAAALDARLLKLARSVADSALR